ncbi:hypothetical protein D3C78_658060 [compost metagenome]
MSFGIEEVGISYAVIGVFLPKLHTSAEGKELGLACVHLEVARQGIRPRNQPSLIPDRAYGEYAEPVRVKGDQRRSTLQTGVSCKGVLRLGLELRKHYPSLDIPAIPVCLRNTVYTPAPLQITEGGRNFLIHSLVTSLI